jgi:wyosine [tRNA(Phe)-imidazoG37] synthetase (radical SAM superfamily)
MDRAVTVSETSSSARGAPELSVPAATPARHGFSAAPFGSPRNFLSNRFVYAVISQRARGLSIGVNLSPDKYCNFNCLYCEVNKDEPVHDRKMNLRVLSTELQSLLALTFQGRLREFPGFHHTPEELLQLKSVALSGNGEPTLSPSFVEVVNEVIHIRSLGRFPFFKIVLITNGSGLDSPEVRGGLKNFTAEDEIWVKLEAGTQAYLDRVNRANLTLKKLMSNILLIARERPVVIQSLFPLIDGEDPPSDEIDEYVHRLKELKADGAQISLVQVYSAHRPPHRPTCGHLPLKVLSRIAQRVREATGLKAEVF